MSTITSGRRTLLALVAYDTSIIYRRHDEGGEVEYTRPSRGDLLPVEIRDLEWLYDNGYIRTIDPGGVLRPTPRGRTYLDDTRAR